MVGLEVVLVQKERRERGICIQSSSRVAYTEPGYMYPTTPQQPGGNSPHFRISCCPLPLSLSLSLSILLSLSLSLYLALSLY